MGQTSLFFLRSWAPFRIDALGIVTMIGAEQVDKAVGRLIRSRYTDYLPLLAAHLVAGNHFTAAVPGFTLYNLSDGIVTTRVSGWFGRWLAFQDLKASTTAFRWTILEKPQKRSWSRKVVPWVIGAASNGFLLILTILTRDWWGLSNSIAIILSVMVRNILISENIAGIDNRVRVRSDVPLQHFEEVKVLITLPNGKVVTLYTPRGLAMDAFTRKPDSPGSHHLYAITRISGWLLFGIHVVALGQSYLLSQVYCVGLLAISTWLITLGVGCNEMEIGNYITVTRLTCPDFDVPDRRIWAYVSMNLSEEEQATLCDTGLVPRRSNESWWDEFEESTQLFRAGKKKERGDA